MELDKIITGDSALVLQSFPPDCIDLTVTSPPYDNLRTYNGYTFDFETIARELFRVTKAGGVVVWVVGDATVKGSETGTSFRQALYFMQCGFNLHDTMIWQKPTFSAVGALTTRYAPVFEYMFIFSKLKIKTFNPIKDRENKNFGVTRYSPTIRGKDGKIRKNKDCKIKQYGQRYNIWNMSTVNQTGDKVHPAPFPEALARDHIISWSNEGDTVLDCFSGSGTTPKMAKLLNRHYIGIDTSAEYVELANKRLEQIGA